MSNSNEKTQLELTSLLLQRFHSIEAQNGTFGPDCRFPQGKRRFGDLPWGRKSVNKYELLGLIETQPIRFPTNGQ